MSIGTSTSAVDGWKSAERALAILQRMETLSSKLAKDYPHVAPDTISYSSVICAFARSGNREGGNRAEELLRRSLRMYYGDEEVGGREALRPDSITCNAVLVGLVRQALVEYSDRRVGDHDRERRGRGRGRHTGEDNKSNARTNTTEGRVEALLQEMHDHHDAGNLHVRPCNISYNILLDLYVGEDKIKAPGNEPKVTQDETIIRTRKVMMQDGNIVRTREVTTQDESKELVRKTEMLN